MSLGNTKIPYLTRLWHPTTGCSGAGCTAKCWARDLVRQRLAGTMKGLPDCGLVYCGLHGKRCDDPAECDAYRDPFTPTFHADRLADPLRARKPQVIGVSFLGDLFDSAISDEQIAAVFGVMAAAPHHTFILLTKQAERLERWHQWLAGRATACGGLFPDETESWLTYQCISAAALNRGAHIVHHGGVWPLPNVWLGVSVSTQAEANARIPHLLRTPAAHRWVSVEPMLEGIDLTRASWTGDLTERTGLLTGIYAPLCALDLVIAGGESSPGARPCDLDWLRSAARQCRDACVAWWVKQVGSEPLPLSVQCDIWFDRRSGGSDERGWPADLRAMRGAVPWMVRP